MKLEDRKKLYAALAAPFPESCIERTDGKLTGRGYDTAGIGYQFIANRFNEVLGVGCFRAHRTVTVKQITRSNGKPAFEAICDLVLELGYWDEDGKFIVFAESLADGGHVSVSEADARKGCFTNAFKKAAAFHGVGRQAYEGTLDDDSLPQDPEEQPVQRFTPPRPPQPSQHAPQISIVKSPAPPRPPPPPQVGTSTAPVAVQRQPSSDPSGRNRVSSKQLGAVWAVARKLGLEQASLRSQVKQNFGTVLEFLSREQASQLIDALNRKLNVNGNGEGDHEPSAAADQAE